MTFYQSKNKNLQKEEWRDEENHSERHFKSQRTRKIEKKKHEIYSSFFFLNGKCQKIIFKMIFFQF